LSGIKKTVIQENGLIGSEMHGKDCFSSIKTGNMYQEEVMVPMGDWANTRLKNLFETDKIRDISRVGSGFGKNISNWIDR